MLGNLGATTRASKGAYIWLMGDDDLIIDGAIEAVLSGLEAHPDVEMAYMNYAYTNFDAPEQLADPDDICAHGQAHRPWRPEPASGGVREVAATERESVHRNLLPARSAATMRCAPISRMSPGRHFPHC